MRRYLGCAVVAALCVMSRAQAPSSAQDLAPTLSPVQIPAPAGKLSPGQFPHFELFRGYSNPQTNFFSPADWAGFDGWDDPLGLNVTDWVGFGSKDNDHGIATIPLAMFAPLPTCPSLCSIGSAHTREGARSDGRLPLAAAALPQTDSAGLERVLGQMDAAARNFKSAEASVVWDQYDRVVNETDTEKGKIYFRRENGEVQMAADFVEPDKKYVIYSSGKVQVYQPKIDQVNEYDAGKNRSEVDSFLVLGFGGGGHDLLKSYDVKFLGTETVNNIPAGKLELIPKSARLKNNIARVLLWIDPSKGVSIQQQFFEPEGDYRLSKYSDIQIGQKLPEGVFKLKTTGKTKFLPPQG